MTLTTSTPTAQQVWYATHQGETSNLATSHYDRWTRDDIAFVVEFTEVDTDVDLAFALGRTLASLWSMQHRLRTEGMEGVVASLTPRVAPRVDRTVCDFVHTFPLGWFD